MTLAYAAGCATGHDSVPMPAVKLQDGHPWTTMDSWYRKPPESFYDRQNAPVDIQDRFVIPIPAQQQAQAQAMLADVSFRVLTEHEASALTLTPQKAEAGMKFYLVRAVCLNAANGKFMVDRIGPSLRVFHGCLGLEAVPMKRAALMVELASPPSEVFVDCSMAP